MALLDPLTEDHSLRPARVTYTDGQNDGGDVLRSFLEQWSTGDQWGTAADMPEHSLRRPLSLLAEASTIRGAGVMEGPLLIVLLAVGILVLLAVFMMMWRSINKRSEEAVPLKAARSAPGTDASLGVASSYYGGAPSNASSRQAAGHVNSTMSTGRAKAGKRMSDMCRGRSDVSNSSLSARTNKSRGTASMGAGGKPPAATGGQQVFVVSLETLVMNSEWGSFGLTDPSSGTQLRVAMVKGPNESRCLRVFKGQSVREPSIELRPPQMGGAPGDAAEGNLEICGPGGEVVGALNLQPNGSFSVSVRGKPQLLIEGSQSSDLDLRICQPGGKLAGTVSCSDSAEVEAANVEFVIQPGIDSMLIVGTVMAVLLLCFDDE